MSFIKEKLPTSGGKRLTEWKQSHLDKSNDSVSNRKVFLYFQGSVGLIYITFTFHVTYKYFLKAHSNINHWSPFFTNIKVRKLYRVDSHHASVDWVQAWLELFLKALEKPTGPVKMDREKGLGERGGAWLWPTFIEYFLCARNCAKHFTSLNPQHILTDEEIVRLRNRSSATRPCAINLWAASL